MIRPAKFAISFTVGSILFFCAFFIYNSNYFLKFFEKDKLLYTVVYILSLCIFIFIFIYSINIIYIIGFKKLSIYYNIICYTNGYVSIINMFIISYGKIWN